MFNWLNRMGCIRRIQVLVSCMGIDIDESIRKSIIHKYNKNPFYAFCNHPDKIPPESLDLLRRDAAAYIQTQKQMAG